MFKSKCHLQLPLQMQHHPPLCRRILAFEPGLPLGINLFSQWGAKFMVLSRTIVATPLALAAVVAISAIVCGHRATSRRALFTHPIHIPLHHPNPAFVLQQQNAKTLMLAHHPTASFNSTWTLSQGSHKWLRSGLHLLSSAWPLLYPRTSASM